MACLDLLNAREGPVLTDYGEDAPLADESEMEGWACPVNLAPPPEDEDDLVSALERELLSLTPWYDLSRERRGRTTFGTSGLSPEDAIAFISAFLDREPDNPRADLSLEELFKQCLEDLKAFYAEAATARPGTASPEAIQDWFWGETALGAVLIALQQRFLNSPDEGFRTLAGHSLVPRAILESRGGSRPARPTWHTPQPEK